MHRPNSSEFIKNRNYGKMRMSYIQEDEDYYNAIRLCLECQQAASTYSYFNCIRYTYVYVYLSTYLCFALTPCSTSVSYSSASREHKNPTHMYVHSF